MALPTTILNPVQQEKKRFTNRKGTLWIQKPGKKPGIPANRHGIKVGLQGSAPKALRDWALFQNGATMAKATMAIRIPSTSKPSAGAWFETIMPYLLNGVVRAIRYGTQVQSGDDNVDILEDQAALLSAVNNGDSLPADSYVKGLGEDDDLVTDLKPAMENMFGSTEGTAFAVTSDVLTITLGTNGTDGNKFWASVNLLNSLPSPLANPDVNGVPQLANCFNPGDFTDFDLQGPTSSVNYTPGNTLVPVTVPTGDGLTAVTGIYFIVSREVLDKISGAVHWTGNSTAEVGLFGANTAAEKLKGSRVIFIWENDGGDYDYIDLYDCLFLNFAQKLKGDAADALQVNIAPQAIAGRVDQYGYEYLAN